MKTFRKTTFKAVLSCAAALASVTASAGDIVTNWDFSTDASFVVDSVLWSGTSGRHEVSTNELSWGAQRSDATFRDPATEAASGGGRSALTIGKAGVIGGDDPTGTTVGGGPATGNVDTFMGSPGFPVAPNFFGLGISFSHWNNVIGQSSLASATIRDTLTLTPLLPDAAIGPVDAPTIDFNIKFFETSNDGSCEVTTPGASNCDDIFAFDLPGGGLNQQFNYDGHIYFAHVVLLNEDLSGVAPITPLGSDICSLARIDLSNDCVGFTTREGERTTINFGFIVSTSRIPVPLPSTLMLFGLGLLGLAYGAKRKAS